MIDFCQRALLQFYFSSVLDVKLIWNAIIKGVVSDERSCHVQ